MEEPMKALKSGVVLTALALAAVPSMAQTRSNTTPPESPGASGDAPGQLKKTGENATDYAPGQMDKGDKGASTNSPGHKMQNSGTPSSSTGSSTGTGGQH
jgi:hypothetical protein